MDNILLYLVIGAAIVAVLFLIVALLTLKKKKKKRKAVMLIEYGSVSVFLMRKTMLLLYPIQKISMVLEDRWKTGF